MNDLYGPLDEKKKKAGSESSKESSLRDWFGRKGAKGSKKGWVDCNSPDGSGGYKACGRGSGENARNTLLADQHRAHVRSAARANHGAKKQNLRKMRIYTWI